MSSRFKFALLGVSFLAGGAAACAAFGSAPKHPALDVFECRAAVLAPYVGDAAEAVAAQIAGGAVNPLALFDSLGLTPDEIVRLAKAYVACSPADAAPAPEPEPALTPA